MASKTLKKTLPERVNNDALRDYTTLNSLQPDGTICHALSTALRLTDTRHRRASAKFCGEAMARISKESMVSEAKAPEPKRHTHRFAPLHNAKVSVSVAPSGRALSSLRGVRAC